MILFLNGSRTVIAWSKNSKSLAAYRPGCNTTDRYRCWSWQPVLRPTPKHRRRNRSRLRWPRLPGRQNLCAQLYSPLPRLHQKRRLQRHPQQHPCRWPLLPPKRQRGLRRPKCRQLHPSRFHPLPIQTLGFLTGQCLVMSVNHHSTLARWYSPKQKALRFQSSAQVNCPWG